MRQAPRRGDAAASVAARHRICVKAESDPSSDWCAGEAHRGGSNALWADPIGSNKVERGGLLGD